MGRKARSDSKLHKLSDEQQEQLFGWCDRDGFQEALFKLKAQYGVKSNIASLHTWYHESATEKQKAKFLKSKLEAQAVGQVIEDVGPYNHAVMVDLQQSAFELLQSGAAPAAVKEFVKLSLLIQDREIDRKNLEQKERVNDQREAALKLRIREFQAREAKTKAALEKHKQAGGLSKEALHELEEAMGMIG